LKSQGAFAGGYFLSIQNTLDKKSGDSQSQEKLVVRQTYINKHYVNPP
jgi:hypothetical protein